MLVEFHSQFYWLNFRSTKTAKPCGPYTLDEAPLRVDFAQYTSAYPYAFFPFDIITGSDFFYKRKKKFMENDGLHFFEINHRAKWNWQIEELQCDYSIEAIFINISLETS